jgi:hypothetical protein
VDEHNLKQADGPDFVLGVRTYGTVVDLCNRLAGRLSDTGYRFSATGPADAPDPTSADDLLAAEAKTHDCRSLHRVWRTTAQGRGIWLYVVRVAADADPLRAYSGLSSQLSVTLRTTWPVEVVVEGRQLPPYQDAALAAMCQVWCA